MANKPSSDERSFGADRERERAVSDESGRAEGSSSAADGADDMSDDGAARARSNRGFASMDRSKQREIASKGGRAAHQKGTAHEFDSSEARAAGRKGGVTVSQNREHMAAIGRRGGEARGANRAARLQQDSENGTSAPTSNRQDTQRFQGDREVGVGANGSQPATNAGGQGTARSSGNSLGGERNTGAASPESNVERP